MSDSGLSPNNILLIVHCAVDVKILGELQRKYPWPRLGKCPKCSSVRLWRHGFVLRYLDGYADQLWMLRYRCPECGSVHTMRPSEYDRMFRAPWLLIFEVLLAKILFGRWTSGISKEKQRYWMKGFRLHASRQCNVSGVVGQLRALGDMVGGVILGTHSTRFYEIKAYREPPHLIFRLSPESGSM